MDFDGGNPYNFPIEPVISNGLGGHFFSILSSFSDNSVCQSTYLHVPGSLALQEAFNCVSKFAGAVVFWLSSSSNQNSGRKISRNSHGSNPGGCKASKPVTQSSIRHGITGPKCNLKSNGQFVVPELFTKISRFTVRNLFKEAEKVQSIPILSLAVALVPSLDNISPGVSAVPLENADMKLHACMDERPCAVDHPNWADLSFLDLKWSRHAVEPRTGIEFPTILDSILGGKDGFSLTSEVLVGTGSRIMKIVKLKSLKLYAFGFYIHPYSLCKKLGPKYASLPVGELNECPAFYKDLLREDVSMTVRLVINCNGMKINTVKDAFEKSLRMRLLKVNPDTDYKCLTTFGSFFNQDIPLPVGTTVDFRRTADGQLITEIEGNQIGVVHSKDLCRAFFDMYIGDIPVSEQTKEEIGRNIASIVGRC